MLQFLVLLTLIINLRLATTVESVCNKTQPSRIISKSSITDSKNHLHLGSNSNNNFEQHPTTGDSNQSSQIVSKAKYNKALFDVEEDHHKQELDDLDLLRLEYNKYKISSNLGITTNPALLARNLTLNQAIRQLSKEELKALRNAEKKHAAINTVGLRRKRSLACSQVKSNKDACCLETFYVNFTDVGWDNWILYPAGYNANYCRGHCDLSHARYYHSTLLSKFSNIIGLCCSPKKMAPLHLLYIDDNNKVLQKTMPDMIVESCDCA